MNRSFIIGGDGCQLTVENNYSSCTIDNNMLRVLIFSNGKVLVEEKSSGKKSEYKSTVSFKETMEKFIDTNKYGLSVSSCEKFSKLAERYLKIGVFA